MRARFSAMLRPTPPGVVTAAPGLEVRHRRLARVRLDVHVGATHHHDRPAVRLQHVAAEDDSFFARFERCTATDACRAEPVGQGCGVEQRVEPQQVDDLALTLGQVTL